MNIKNRINRLEAQIRDENGGYYCQCYEQTIDDFPERISTDWLETDVCGQCGKAVNQTRIKEIFSLYQLADERLAEIEKANNRRQI